MLTIPDPSLQADDATFRAALAAASADGKLIVGMIGVVVPPELILAAGCFPVTLCARAEDWGRDAAPMEAGHEPEMQSLFLRAIDGDVEACDVLVIPSSTDGLRFLFQYLKEMVRQGRGERVPPLVCYDFLFGRSEPVRRYSRQVQQGLARRLEVLNGRAVTPEALRAAIDATNAVREQWRRLNLLRMQGRVSGVAAHGAMRAAAFLPPEVYAPRLAAWADALASEPAEQTLPRVLLVPAVPLYHEHLHLLVEQAGAIVTAEDDEWGSRRGDAGIGGGVDAAGALFDYYYNHGCSQRMWRAEREAWLAAEMARGEAEAVVFYIPPSDQAFGWRYPDLNHMAQAHGIPALLVRDDVLDPAARPAIAAQLAGFVAGLPRRTTPMSAGANQ